MPTQSTRFRKPIRSEEHTSEHQSPCNLVCRLLLEKNEITPPRADDPPGFFAGIIRLYAGTSTRTSAARQTTRAPPPGTGASGDVLQSFFFNGPTTPEFYPLSLNMAYRV